MSFHETADEPRPFAGHGQSNLIGLVLMRALTPPEAGGGVMMPNRTHAKIFARALVGGMMLVLVVVLSGCEAQRGDPDTASWDQYIKAMDDALARGDFYAADLARQTAYLMALGSQRWEAMVAMGDAYARFADAQGASPTLRSEARRVLRAALSPGPRARCARCGRRVARGVLPRGHGAERRAV